MNRILRYSLLIFFTGIAKVSFSQTDNSIAVSFDTLSIDCLKQLNSRSIVITNQNELEDLDIQRKGYDCDPLPEIDFETKILLGYSVDATGCSPPTCIVNIKNGQTEHIVYIKVVTDGICRLLFRKVFWYVIDRPDNPKNIRFEKIK